MAELIAAQAAVLMVPTLGRSGKNEFQAKLKAQLATVKASLDVEVKAQTAKMLSEIEAAKKAAEATPINLRVATDKDGFREIVKDITEIRHKYEDLGSKVRSGLSLNLKVVGASQLTQLGTALGAVNQSIVALSQSSLLLPGILSGVAASIGSVVIGTRGLSDAFKAQTAVQKDSANAARQQVDAQREVAAATRDLNRATRDAARNLEDLNTQLRDAPLDEASALLDLQEAQNEEAKRFGKTMLEQQRDTIRRQKAESALAETRRRGIRLAQDAADANRKGVQGADTVVSATERLAKAQEDVAKGTTAVNNLADAMNKLGPGARDFVEKMESVKGAWADMRNAVGDRLFAGLGDEVKGLAASDLPLLQKGLGDIAGAINGNLKTAIHQLSNGTNKGFLSNIFGNTAEAQKALGTAINPLIDGFLRLSSVGSEFLPRLATGLGSVLTRFDNFIIKAQGDGSLNKWIENGIQAFKDLGNSLINVGSIMNSISEAFTGSGGKGLLGSLADGSKRLADFLKSAAGQSKLQNFFRDARDELSKWKPVLAEIPKMVQNVAQAGQGWANLLLPFLRQASTLLGEHPGLVSAILYAYLGWKTISPIVMGLKGAIDLSSASVGFFRDKTDDAGKKVDSGFKQKMTGLKNFMGGGGPFMLALSGAATFLATQLVNAHDDAAAAADRQKSHLDGLVTTLDNVTGAATNASKSLIAKNLREGKNQATGSVNGDQTKALKDLGFEPSQVIDQIAAGDPSQTLGKLGSITREGVDQIWGQVDPNGFGEDTGRRVGEILERNGISKDVLAAALGGDPAAKKQFEDFYWKRAESVAPPGVSDHGTIRGLQTAGLMQLPSDLANLTDMLPDRAKKAAQAAGQINSEFGARTTGAANIQQDNRNAFGNARMVAGNPLNQYGIVGQPGWDEYGGAHVTVTRQPPAEWLQQMGISAVPGPGGFSLTIPQTAVGQFVERFAHGGFLSGAGTGTSDSMLARVSNGEFISRASSVEKYGSDFYHALNAGKIDPSALPGFDQGGGWFPDGPPKPPAPTPAASAPTLLDSIASKPIDTTPPPPLSASGQATIGTNPPSTTPTNSGGTSLNPTSKTWMQKWLPSNPLDSALWPAIGRGAKAVGTGVADAGRWVADNWPSSQSITAKPNDFSMHRDHSSPGWKPQVNPNDPGVGNLATSRLLVPGFAALDVAPLPGAAGAKIPGLDLALKGAAGVPKPTATGSKENFGLGPLPDPATAVANLPGLSLPGGQNHMPTGAVSPGPGNGTPHLAGAVTPAGSTTPVVQKPVSYAGTPSAPIYAPVATASGGAYAPSGPIQQRMSEFAQFAATKPYVWGGFSPEGMDCSGLALAFANIATGRDPFAGGRNATAAGQQGFSTANEGAELTARGFVAGDGGPGTLTIGWSDSHTGVTLPDGTHIDAQGDATGIVMGQGSQGATGFPNVMHLPIPSGSPLLSPDGLQLPGTGATGLPAPMDGDNQGGLGALLKGLPNELRPDKIAWEFGNILLSGLLGFFGINADSILGPLNQVLGFGSKQLTGQGSDRAGELSQDRENGVLSNPYAAAYQQAFAGGGGAAVSAGTLSASSGKLEVARKIISEAQRRGYSTDQIIAILSTGLQESGLDPKAQGGGGAWHGIFQQDAGYAGRDDPNQNIGAFLDRLTSKGGTDGDIWKNIFWLQQRPGEASADAAFANGRQGYMTEVQSRLGEARSLFLQATSGYASGGMLSGPGTGTSDSILARVSNGEFISRASSVAKYGPDFYHALNAGKVDPRAVQGFADGGMPLPLPIPGLTPSAPDPAQAPGPLPVDQPAPQNPQSPQAQTDTATQAVGNAMQGIGSALGGVGGGASPGASGPEGSTPEQDPRAVLGAAPTNLDHNAPWVSQGIQGAASTIGSAIGTAVGLATAAGTGGAGAAGAGAASSLAQGGAQIAGQVASGAANILSSLFVGTLTGGSTQGAYGAPLLPQAQQNPAGAQGPRVVNNYGDIHTASYDQFYQGQQRREAQQQAPFMPMK